MSAGQIFFLVGVSVFVSRILSKFFRLIMAVSIHGVSPTEDDSGSKPIYVGQEHFIFVSPGNKEVGSFGARPCVLLAIVSKFGILFGHIDAMTSKSCISEKLFSFKDTFEDYLECRCFLTSGDGSDENSSLRLVLTGIMESFGLKPQVISSTQLIVDFNGNLITSFDVECFDRIEVDQCISEKGEQLLDKDNLFWRQVGDHMKRVEDQTGLDEFGRPPPPKELGWGCKFDFSVGKWVHMIENKDPSLRSSIFR